jgi:hypothetical protein
LVDHATMNDDETLADGDNLPPPPFLPLPV